MQGKRKGKKLKAQSELDLSPCKSVDIFIFWRNTVLLRLKLLTKVMLSVWSWYSCTNQWFFKAKGEITPRNWHFPICFVSVLTLDNTFLVNCTIQYWNKRKFNKAVCARLAQLVRSLTVNLKVSGSIPGLVEGWTLGDLLSPHRPWTGTLSRWSSLSTFYRETWKNPHTCR